MSPEKCGTDFTLIKRMRRLSFNDLWFKSITPYVWVLCFTLLLTLPGYITAYRVSVADLVPFDNYRQMVITLADGTFPRLPAPFGYRLLAPALASRLFPIHPPVFSQLSQNISSEWIRSTFALCTVSYLFLLATTVVLYGYMRDLGIPLYGNILALCVFWLSPACEIYLYPTVDASAFFFIAALYWTSEQNRPILFLLASLFGALAKESTILVVGSTFLVQSIFWTTRRPRALKYLMRLLPAALTYFGLRMILQLPENAAQFALWEYPSRLFHLFHVLFNLRGVLLNLYPLWPIGLALMLVPWLHLINHQTITKIFHWSHSLVPLGFMFLGAVLEVKYNLGRIVFLSFPLFIPIVGLGLASVIEALERQALRL